MSASHHGTAAVPTVPSIDDSAPITTSKRPLVLATLMVGMFMAAVEGTVVATAVPAIVADLGGFAHFSWVFSAFLLAQAAVIPLYGKLADMYGRKPAYAIGACLFLIGSALCGFSRTMTQLIVFRAIQGLGAGAIVPIATTIVGDIYTVQERARIQGLLASVWAVSSVVGPPLGGFLVTYVSWPWIFWINLPVGVISVAGLLIYLQERVQRRTHRPDYAGSVALVFSVSTLILAVSGVPGASSSSAMGFSQTSGLVLGLAALAGLVLFVWIERRAAEPILPLDLLKRPVIAPGNLGGLLAGALTLGTTSYVPTYVQGVLGASPTVAGFSLGAMSIGWPIASTISGFSLLRLGFRTNALMGASFSVAGATWLSFLTPTSSPVQVAMGTFFIGAGLGFVTNTYTVAIQTSVTFHERGVATSSNAFARMLGGTIGVAALGSLVNIRMTRVLANSRVQEVQHLGVDAANQLLDPGSRSTLSPETLTALKQALFAGTHSLFIGLAVMAAAVWATAVWLPAGRIARSRSQAGRAEPHGESSGGAH